MGKKISELASASAFDGTELFEAVQSGANVKGVLGALGTPAYLDGLTMQWLSGNALTVSSGAAFISSLGRVVRVPAAITKTGLTLTASTWYHVYLLLNGAAPDIELVTTAPSAPYNGTARSKNGDSSRRYVGSVLTDATGQLNNFLQLGQTIHYLASLNPLPFVVLSGGTAGTSTTVSCSGIVPVTARLMSVLMLNNGNQDVVFSNSGTGFALSSTNYLQYIRASTPAAFDFPLDSNQAFQYLFPIAPTSGGCYVRVAGYRYDR